MAQLIKCPHCGKFIDKSSNICPKCSMPLTASTPKPEQAQAAPKVEEAPKVQAQPQPKAQVQEAPVQKQQEEAPVNKAVREEPKSEPKKEANETPIYRRRTVPENENTEDRAEEAPKAPKANEQVQDTVRTEAKTVAPKAPVAQDPQPKVQAQPKPKQEKPKETQAPKPQPKAAEESISSNEEMEKFLKSMKKQNSEDSEEDSPKEEGKTKKLTSIAGNFATNLVNNSKALIGKPKAEDDEPVEEEDEPEAKAAIRKARQKSSEDNGKPAYNANADGYYDYVTAEIDARTEHVTTEMVIKTVSFIAIVIVIVTGMINFI